MCNFFNPGLLMIYGFILVLSVVLGIIGFFAFICDEDIMCLLGSVMSFIVAFAMYFLLHMGGVF